MPTVGIRAFKQRTSAILRRVRNRGEVFEITYRGQPVARLVPLAQARHDLPASTSWKSWDELTDAIATRWRAGASAIDAVREQRREL